MLDPTVVVCEDDDPTRELLCDHLTADRYRALPAPSASDVLRLCGYNHPDLMLLHLDLLFLDSGRRVIELRRDVPPGRLIRCREAADVLELPSPM